MENNIEILLRLIFVHILSDFILQNKKMVSAKQCDNKATKYGAIAVHSLIHSVLSYIVIMQWQCWIVPLIIFISHFCIDCLKSNCKNNGILPFLVDQFLHISIIIGVWLVIYATPSTLPAVVDNIVNNENVLVIIIAYLLVLKPASIVLSLFFGRWNIEDNMKGLPNAGKWIGYLERALVLTFILSSQVEMIGFLIAAKSIFRFGELKQANEIKITEYILIGTFASFAIAIIIGYITKLLFV